MTEAKLSLFTDDVIHRDPETSVRKLLEMRNTFTYVAANRIKLYKPIFPWFFLILFSFLDFVFSSQCSQNPKKIKVR